MGWNPDSGENVSSVIAESRSLRYTVRLARPFWSNNPDVVTEDKDFSCIYRSLSGPAAPWAFGTGTESSYVNRNAGLKTNKQKKYVVGANHGW